VAGKPIQSLAIAGFVVLPGFSWRIVASVFRGAGTAFDYRR
jgi:hypothetical protein